MTIRSLAATFLMGTLILESAWGIEPEPDWTNRFVMLKSELAQSFTAPKVGERVTLIRRVGGPYTGQINAITRDTITVDGKQYEARQLTDDTCAEFFPEAYARQTARSQVFTERDAYRRRVAAEQEQSRLAASRAAKMSSLQPQVEPAGTSPVSSRKPPLPSAAATTTPASQDSGAWKIILVIVGICCVLAMSASKNKGKKIARAKRFLADVKAKKGFTPIRTNLILNTGEQAFLETTCTLYEARSVRTRQSTDMGFGMAKELFFGTGKSRYVSIPTRTQIDAGRLTLTSKRLVFDGRSVDRSIPLSKIMSVHPLSNALEVSTETRGKSMYFAIADPLIWAKAIRIFAAVPNPTALNEVDLNIQLV